MNHCQTTDLDLGDELICAEISDEALEAAAGMPRGRELAGQSFNPGAVTVNFVCCSEA